MTEVVGSLCFDFKQLNKSELGKAALDSVASHRAQTRQNPLADAQSILGAENLTSAERNALQAYQTSLQNLQSLQQQRQQLTAQLQQTSLQDKAALQNIRSRIDSLDSQISKAQASLHQAEQTTTLSAIAEKTRTAAEQLQSAPMEQNANSDQETETVALDEAIQFFGTRNTNELQSVIKRGTIKLQNGFSCFPDGDPLNNNVSKVPSLDGYFDIAMHGTPTAVCFGTENANMTARLLASVIRHSENYNGQPIRLLSCSTGAATADTVCFAEDLANALGVEVIAPNDTLYISPQGNMRVGKSADGEFVVYKPNHRRRLK